MATLNTATTVTTLFTMIGDKTTSAIKSSAFAQAWADTTGNRSDANGFSNCDTYAYFKAILDDGSEVQCKTEVHSAAFTRSAEFHPSSASVIGTNVLPSNWVEIRFYRYRYYDFKNQFAAPNYTKGDNGIVVARNNMDGTCTVYNTKSDCK